MRRDPMSPETDVRRQIANVNPDQHVSDPVFSLTTRLEPESEWALSTWKRAAVSVPSVYSWASSG